jgi:ATP-dependent protease ClpP protease subunit
MSQYNLSLKRKSASNDKKKRHGKKFKVSSSSSSSSDDSSSLSEPRAHPHPPPPLEDVRADGNHIYFQSRVCDSSISKLINIINSKNTEYQKIIKNDILETATPKPLWLHITSYGGSLFACFMAIDSITNSIIPIYTVVDGYAASAGTLMSVVGKKRYMTSSSYMLIHQLSSGMGGNFWQIKDEYINLEMMMEDIYNTYLKHTKMTREELIACLSHDSWWKLDKCLESGLVDEVYVGNT